MLRSHCCGQYSRRLDFRQVEAHMQQCVLAISDESEIAVACRIAT